MSKEEILEAYLNTINLGASTYGVEAACLRYFGKSCSEVTASEAAVIAGIANSPTYFDPISYPENNKERRDKTLNDMLEQGYLTQAEYDEAMADDVYARIAARPKNRAETRNSLPIMKMRLSVRFFKISRTNSDTPPNRRSTSFTAAA